MEVCHLISPITTRPNYKYLIFCHECICFRCFYKFEVQRMPAFHKFSKWNCCSYQLQTWTNQGLQSSISFCEPIYSWNAEKEKKNRLLIKSLAENHSKRASFTRSR